MADRDQTHVILERGVNRMTCVILALIPCLKFSNSVNSYCESLVN